MTFQPSLKYPHRWQDWASPDDKKRLELQMGTLGGFMSFVNGELIRLSAILKTIPEQLSARRPSALRASR